MTVAHPPFSVEDVDRRVRIMVDQLSVMGRHDDSRPVPVEALKISITSSSFYHPGFPWAHQREEGWGMNQGAGNGDALPFARREGKDGILFALLKANHLGLQKPSSRLLPRMAVTSRAKATFSPPWRSLTV